MPTSDRVTSQEVWDFATEIIWRFATSRPVDRKNEARLFYALARDYLRLATPPKRS